MNNVLQRIKDEKINTFSSFYRELPDGSYETYGYYICTMTSDEIDISMSDNRHFMENYEIIQTSNIIKNTSGYVIKSFDYKVIEKKTGNIVYEQ